MKICLVSVEIFAWGKYGGFGRATRTIGRELVARGHEVFAVVPRREGQGPVEQLDGMTVLSFPQNSWFACPALTTNPSRTLNWVLFLLFMIVFYPFSIGACLS